MEEKNSYGVLLCRKNPKDHKPEVLIVHKRFTYAYSDFVCGFYDETNMSTVQKLLNEMSAEELVDVYSLNFRHMWYKVWLKAEGEMIFAKKQMKFYSNFVNNPEKQAQFKSMIEKTRRPHGDPLWEFPKGRKRDRESELLCAVREFTEETRIDKRCYFLYDDVFRYTSFVQDGCRYNYKFYLALAGDKLSSLETMKNFPSISCEVNDIQWANIDRIRLIDIDHRLERIITPMFRYLSKTHKYKSTNLRINKTIEKIYTNLEPLLSDSWRRT